MSQSNSPEQVNFLHLLRSWIQDFGDIDVRKHPPKRKMIQQWLREHNIPDNQIGVMADAFITGGIGDPAEQWMLVVCQCHYGN